jgi:signal transduction histidine kinase
MFRRIRLGMTAWYAGILGATLLVMGIVLYLGEQESLISPVDDELRATAQSIETSWQVDPLSTCHRASAPLWACYNSTGVVIDESPFISRVPDFRDASLVNTALRAGKAVDTVDSGGIRLYATRFPVVNPDGSNSYQVLELGLSVSDRTTALNRLLYLLILCGSLGVLFATLSGVFLANRSLRPVREAYTRQQDFVANASHELRTPLTMVRADAEVLLRDREHLNEDQIAILEDVVLEASHMASLATSMLELARLDAGKLRLDNEVVDLTAMAQEIVRRASALAQQRTVSVHVADSPPVLVFGDPLLLEHVALILVDNAIKYNVAGGDVFLRTEVNGSLAVLEVRDTGIGIPSEHLPHIGERFYRMDKARSREAGGAGLGLSIVRSVIANHNGAVALTSEPGSGTTARITLPALEPQEVHHPPGQQTSESLPAVSTHSDSN